MGITQSLTALPKMNAPFTACGAVCGRVARVGPNCSLRVGELVFGFSKEGRGAGALAEECLVLGSELGTPRYPNAVHGPLSPYSL